jgi:aryl-alcohol dehydrogenase-like predicted oxidoreductase
VYGSNHSEELLAKALGSRRKDIMLVTKMGLDSDDEPKVIGRNSNYAHIIERTERCLRRMDTDVIDLVLIHWPDHDTPFDETMRALEQWKSAGKIRHYGVSNFTVEMMEKGEQTGQLVANQVGYHMFDQRMESAVLPYCAETNTGYGVRESGVRAAVRGVHARDNVRGLGLAEWREGIRAAVVRG